MLEVMIHYPGGSNQKAKLVPGLYRVGSSPASHIQIDRPEVSGRHATFTVSETELRVADLGSSNGTFIDGEAVGSEPEVAPRGSVIAIGEARIDVLSPEPRPEPTPTPASKPATPKEREQNAATPATPNSSTPSHPTPPTPPVAPVSRSIAGERTMERDVNSPIETSFLHKAVNRAEREANANQVPVLRLSGIPDVSRPIVQEIKRQAHFELLKRLNLKRLAVSGTSEDELKERAKSTIHAILSEISAPLPYGVTREKIEKELLNEAVGLGPLEDLIAIDEITEIMVNGPTHVFVERKGTLYKTDTAFADDHQVIAAIERIVSPLGRRIDESSPMVDARLQDGSRVNAIIPPLALDGPSITIRKFSKDPFKVEDLIGFGSLTHDIAEFLRACVAIRKNIIISGGTGSGKTTLLNVLSSFLPARERIVTVEDAAELQLGQEHVVRLEARPPNIEGKGAITIRDLVRNCLRMRPDRIVVGECRGGEALDMLQAMNTGHDGSLTTVHANSARDALARLETLVLMAGFDLPLRAIREQICSAVDIIVQVSRLKDGSRRLLSVSEIVKMEGDIITMQDFFEFKHRGWTASGKIEGGHEPTGAVPTFMDEIRRAKIDLDISVFNREATLA